MTRNDATTYTDEFGPNTLEVARFLSAIESLTTDQLVRASAASGTDDLAWENAWSIANDTAEAVGRYDEFDAAIDAAWAHAARHPDFEQWDHVWEHAAGHTAAALVLSGSLDPVEFNRLTQAFIAADVTNPASGPQEV